MKHIHIIYHRVDFDGILSGIIAREGVIEAYKDTPLEGGYDIIMHGWDYGDPTPPIEFTAAGDIYMVDVTVPELLSLGDDVNEKIVWIDHHKSAIEKYDHNIVAPHRAPRNYAGIREDGTAACRLCWRYFFTGTAEPKMVYLAGLYDVWKHDEEPDALPLQFAMKSVPITIDTPFTTITNDEYCDDILVDGRILDNYVKQTDKFTLDVRGYKIKFHGLTFAVLNTAFANSLAFQSLEEKSVDAFMSWRYDGTQVSVSMYHAPHNTGINLSEIAAQYGGGGHAGACGFRCSLQFMETQGPMELIKSG